MVVSHVTALRWRWSYLFAFPFGGDVLGGLRRRLLLLRGRVHDDWGGLDRGGELRLGRVVGPC